MEEHGHQLGDSLDLRLPVLPSSVTIGRRAAAQFAEETGCSGETLWQVRLAVSEALSNVVLHAHPPEEAPLAHLTLAARADEGQITISITDAGSGLQARSDSPGMGLGLSLIAKSCTELELDTAASGGTVVRMTFLR